MSLLRSLDIHFTIRGHGFTHCDAPRHMRRDGLTIQQLPNQGLDVFNGEAKIIDLSDLPLPTRFTPELISARAGVIREGDMVVLRSDLTNRMGYESRQWHLAAPNLEPTAAELAANISKLKALVPPEAMTAFMSGTMSREAGASGAALAAMLAQRCASGPPDTSAAGVRETLSMIGMMMPKPPGRSIDS